MSVKQVIVMRKDLKMRRGKEIAQGAHAAMKWLIERLEHKDVDNPPGMQPQHYFELVLSETEKAWVDGLFTKITLQVDSEAALLEVYEKAKAADLVARLIEDSGATEFHGVKTATCCAIGPDEAERIDPVTQGLELR